MLTGKQRLGQVKRKARILAARQLRAFMAEGGVLMCSGDQEDRMIEAEFERVYAMGVAAGRRALTANTGAPDA